MWDEKKFFEDFVTEADKVKPDPEFVEKMVAMAGEEKSSKVTPFQSVRKWAPAVAAACIVCMIGIGKFMQMEQPAPNSEMEQIGMLAGKNSEELEFSESVADVNSDVLKMVKTKLDDGTLICDENHAEISQEERNELLTYAGNAVLTEDISEKEVRASYTIEGESEIEINITEDNFMIIGVGEKEFYYKFQ